MHSPTRKDPMPWFWLHACAMQLHSKYIKVHYVLLRTLQILKGHYEKRNALQKSKPLQIRPETFTAGNAFGYRECYNAPPTCVPYYKSPSYPPGMARERSFRPPVLILVGWREACLAGTPTSFTSSLPLQFFGASIAPLRPFGDLSLLHAQSSPP